MSRLRRILRGNKLKGGGEADVVGRGPDEEVEVPWFSGPGEAAVEEGDGLAGDHELHGLLAARLQQNSSEVL